MKKLKENQCKVCGSTGKEHDCIWELNNIIDIILDTVLSTDDNPDGEGGEIAESHNTALHEIAVMCESMQTSNFK